jgi:hypothetical protein
MIPGFRYGLGLTIETPPSNFDPMVVVYVKNTSIYADHSHAIPDAFLLISLCTSRF